jgi:hypothetical protein
MWPSRAMNQTLRPQYHFRKSPQGLLAWDVRRLVKLSATLPVHQVAVSTIAELNEVHWYGHDTAAPTCASIVEHCSLILAADLSYPIILDEQARVMDGMHRVCKALMQGLTHVSAVRFPVDPAPDYVDREPDTLPYE